MRMKKLKWLVGAMAVLGVLATPAVLKATITNTTTMTTSALGNGATVNYTIGFPFQANSQITVYLQTESATPYTRVAVTYGAGAGKYTITGGDPGTTVVMGTAPTTSQRVIIKRVSTRTQTVDYNETEAFPAANHESEMDKLTQVIQEVDYDLTKKLGLAVTSTYATPTLPEPYTDRFISYNHAGTDLTLYPSTSSSLATGDVLRYDTTTGWVKSTALTSHLANVSNPHSVTAAQIGGNAIMTEINAGSGVINWNRVDKSGANITDIPTRSHTSLTDIGSNTHAQIDSHIANVSNPHNVTAAQVGAATAQWNASQIMGVTVDDAAKADGRVLNYNLASNKIIYSPMGIPALTNGKILIGDVSNAAAEQTMSGDATITRAGVLTVANNAVTSAKILDGEIVNADVNAAAAIVRTKLASGTNYRLLSNDATGVMSENAALTATGVPYADANGQLATSSANFAWDNTNKRLGLGTDASLNSLTISGVNYGSTLTVDAEGATDLAELGIHRHSATAGLGSHIVQARSRGTNAAPTVVSSGDVLSRIDSIGYDGTDYELAGQIDVEVDGTPGANDMPGRIKFSVTPDGSATVAEAMRISNDKSVRTSAGVKIGATTAPDASSMLDIESTTKGALFPRMTTAQRDAIGTPATGLQVYNTTTNKVNVYNGTSWQEVGGGAGGIFAGGQNLITNNSWENDTSGWTASAGTYQRETAAGSIVPPGVGSASWDPAAANDTLTANNVTITTNDGLSGQNGVLSCAVKTAATDLKMQVYDGTNVISPDASTDVVPSSSAGFVRYSVNFIFPTSGTIKARFKAQSNSVIAYIDDCYLGKAEGFNAFNAIGVATSWQSCTLTSIGWGGTATSTCLVQRIADMAHFRVRVSSGAAPTGTTLLVTLPSGYVIDTTKIQGTGQSENMLGTTVVRDSSTASYTNASVLYNNTTSVYPVMMDASGIWGKDALVSTTSPITFGANDFVDMNFAVPIVGWSGENAYRPDVSSRYWSGYHDNTCDGWNTTSTAFADPSNDGTCGFTELQNKNFGTVSSNGAKTPGITFTPSRSGTIWACAITQGTNNTTAKSSVYQLTDGTNVLAIQGNQTAATTTSSAPITLCGILPVVGGVSTTLKIQAKTDTGGTAYWGALVSSGTHAVDWSLVDISQSVPAPLLVGSVTASSTTVKSDGANGLTTVDYGTYTPTLANIANTSARTAYTTNYMRVGNVVTVSGRFDANATSASGTDTQISMTLPVTTAFTAREDAGGNNNADDASSSDSGPIYAISSSATVLVGWKASVTGNNGHYFHFTYRVK